MKKLYVFLIFLVGALGAVAFKGDFIATKLQQYVADSAQKNFGNQPVAEQHEHKIRSIADQMGMQQPFTIRKMNAHSTQALGYYNAFALQPLLFNCIPVGQAPFLFISEGFFEDLSHQEQEFVIGHELIHIERAHVRYFNLIVYFLYIVTIALWWLMRRSIRSVSGKRFWLYPIISLILIECCSIPIDLAGYAYKRSIEREADSTSLALLKSYDGGLALIKRWQKEFKMPLHNNWCGLFSDHPSCQERITYFSQLKQQHEGTDYEQC